MYTPIQITIPILLLSALIHIIKFLSAKKKPLKSSLVATDFEIREIQFYQKLTPIDITRFLKEVNSFYKE